MNRRTRRMPSSGLNTNASVATVGSASATTRRIIDTADTGPSCGWVWSTREESRSTSREAGSTHTTRGWRVTPGSVLSAAVRQSA